MCEVCSFTVWRMQETSGPRRSTPGGFPCMFTLAATLAVVNDTHGFFGVGAAI